MGAGQAIARDSPMKRNEGLYRTVRFVKHLVIGIASLVLIMAAVGYFFLMRQVDPRAAWKFAERELAGGMLHYGERPIRVAHVYVRRPTSYFRAASGLLVATPERVLFVGVEPRDKLAGADAPAPILTSEFTNDTLLSARNVRLYAFTAHGILLSQGSRAQAYAASSGHDAEMDALLAYVQRHQREQRAAAIQDRELRAQLASLLKQPLTYVVERGDAVSTIAARFGATPEQIREWNHLSNDRIRAGQTLLVRPGK